MSLIVDIVNASWKQDIANKPSEITVLATSGEDSAMNEDDAELIEALDLLFKGRASEAIHIAAKHGELPLAKCILFLAYDFFFLEPAKAADVFGGDDGLREVLGPDRVEGYILEGYRAVFCGDPGAALHGFQAALRLAPGDPFILFGIAVARLRQHHPTAAAAAILKVEEVNPLHPLVGLFRKMLQNYSDY